MSPRAWSETVLGPSSLRRASGDRHGVAAADCAGLDDLGVDTDVRVVALRGRPQHAGILGQVSLGERRHDAARTGAGDPQANLAADRKRLAHPLVLDEAALVARDDDVRPETPNLETACRVELAQVVERGRGEDV